MIRLARRISSLSLREGADLARAQIAILGAAWQLRRVRIGDLVAGSRRAAANLNAQHDKQRRMPRPADATRRATELARAIGRVARFGLLRPACLVRSIALQNLLSTNGIAGSVIRVGVHRERAEFAAHAWVELNGAVLGDDPGRIARFTPLNALAVRTSR